jgi:hypothetical protein
MMEKRKKRKEGIKKEPLLHYEIKTNVFKCIQGVTITFPECPHKSYI